MANKKITTENYWVIANGSVATFKKEKLTIDFTDSGNNDLKINLIFLNDSSKKKDIEVKASPDHSDVSIYNAQGIAGVTEPLQIATDTGSGKSLYLSFSFQEISESFMVHYTIFEQK